MASELLGRAACPECGFASAHIKIKTDKEGANPYRHCPECGAQYFPRNKTQADNLRAQLKPAKIDTPAPNTSPAEVAKPVQELPAPAMPRFARPKQKPGPKVIEPPPQEYEVVFGVRVPKGGAA